MKSYRYLHLDVFTDRLFTGNQLAVFPEARGLATETMQAIANEMNFSETTFVLPAERVDTDVRMRIFTPRKEMPMAGHPTTGSTFALARTGQIAPRRDRFIFGLNIGPVPVSLAWHEQELMFVWMTQLNPTFAEAIANRAGAARALGLTESALAGALPVQVVSCGVPCLLVPLATRADVDRAALDRSNFQALVEAEQLSTECVFLFSTEKGADRATAYSRMFAPDEEIEDPATGSASGPLGCYLVQHHVVERENAGKILSLQGVKMGRPSQIHISIGSDGGDIVSVRVGGEAVLVGEGTLQIP
jgi:trans-2,3-dihydro-3-hydroxyanthranilate isomerase